MTINDVIKGNIKALKCNMKNGKKPKARILVYGYFAENFGDDMFFEMLFERYPNTLFYVLFHEYYRSKFDKYNNVAYFSFSDSNAVKMLSDGAPLNDGFLVENVFLCFCDAAVHIGGSVYQQSDNWRDDLFIRKNRHDNAKRFYGISNNFGPYVTEDYLESWKTEFKKFKNLCFRDRYSFELFKDNNAVSYAPDALFSYKAEKSPKCEKSIAVSLINTRLPVRNIPKEICDSYISGISALSEEKIKEGFSVKLLDFCTPEEDNAAIEEIMGILPDEAKKNVTVHHYSGNTKETVDIINSCEYIIATRFHACVMGYVLGKKVIPVCYSDKTKNMLKDIGVNDIIELTDKDSTGFENLKRMFGNAKVIDVGDSKITAEKQFFALDKLIRRKLGKIVK